MQLRPYQEAALTAIANKKRALVVMPCGTGKSLTFTTMIEREQKNLAVVVMPSRPLVDQFNRCHLEKKLCGFASICVCSDVGTKVSRKIQQFLSDEDRLKVIAVTYHSFAFLVEELNGTEIDLLVWDEAHHLTSESCAKLLDSGYTAKSETFWTATPKSTDHFDLGSHLAFEFTPREAFESGFCKPVDMVVFDRKMSCCDMLALAAVEKVKQAGFCNMLTIHQWIDDVEKFAATEFTECVERLAAARKILVRSIKVKRITGKTRAAERAQIYKSFNGEPRDGHIVLLASCKTLREGVDMRYANVEVLFDNVRDVTRATQLMGRIMRKGDHPGWLVFPKVVDKGETQAVRAALRRQKCYDVFYEVLVAQGLQPPRNKVGKKQVANPNPKRRGPNMKRRDVLRLTLEKADGDSALVFIRTSMVAQAPTPHKREVKGAVKYSNDAELNEFTWCEERQCTRCCAFRARLETVEGRQSFYLSMSGIWDVGLASGSFDDFDQYDTWLLHLLSAEADMTAARAKKWLLEAWLTRDDGKRDLLGAHGKHFIFAYNKWWRQDRDAVWIMLNPALRCESIMHCNRSTLHLRALECVLEAYVLDRPDVPSGRTKWSSSKDCFDWWNRLGAGRTGYQACLWAYLGKDVSDFPIPDCAWVWSAMAVTNPTEYLEVICRAHLYQKRKYDPFLVDPLHKAVGRTRLLAGPHTNALLDRLELGKMRSIGAILDGWDESEVGAFFDDLSGSEVESKGEAKGKPRQVICISDEESDGSAHTVTSDESSSDDNVSIAALKHGGFLHTSDSESESESDSESDSDGKNDPVQLPREPDADEADDVEHFATRLPRPHQYRSTVARTTFANQERRKRRRNVDSEQGDNGKRLKLPSEDPDMPELEPASGTIAFEEVVPSEPVDMLGQLESEQEEMEPLIDITSPPLTMPLSSSSSEENQYQERMSQRFFDLLQYCKLKGPVALLGTRLKRDDDYPRHVCDTPAPTDCKNTYSGDYTAALNSKWAKVRFCGAFFGVTESLDKSLEALFMRPFVDDVFMLGLTSRDLGCKWYKDMARKVRQFACGAGFTHCQHVDDDVDYQFGHSVITHFYVCHKQ